jgi:hypothetical protein
MFSRTIIDSFRSIIDTFRRIIDYSTVTHKPVESLMIVIYDRHTFIVRPLLFKEHKMSAC